MTGRTEHEPILTPGPGHYEHEIKKTANQIQDEKIREMKRMTSWQPRTLDILYRVKMREVTLHWREIILKYNPQNLLLINDVESESLHIEFASTKCLQDKECFWQIF